MNNTTIAKTAYTMTMFKEDLEKAKQQLIDLGYDISQNKYDLTFNLNGYKTVGRCKRFSNTYFLISINEKYINVLDRSSIQNTIMHELIHSLKGCMNHGTQWQMIAQRVNYKYNYHISRLTSKEDHSIIKSFKVENNCFKYKVICSHCNNEIFYHKANKLITLLKNNTYKKTFRCGKCKNDDFSLCVLK